ncbi:peptidoglycan binding protein CsiV [Candidatus Photodesmus blepharus]|uniref:peptidoglycan binding protein CsiV n=1 Tax=Candidatus Photodesmus blepharonis TaxID=1179155 RepID=UPI0005537EFB|nr:peptidoglycan binding protein CsiV [Candidatus Photodesmus blepharus]
MKTLISLLVLFLPLDTMAKKQFDIEVIIFKRVADERKSSESWPNIIPKISMEHVGSFEDKNYLVKKKAKVLPYSEYKLIDQAKSLEKYEDFTVLFHRTWRQGNQGKAYSPIFHIQGGEDYSKQSSFKRMPEPFYELDGKLQVYVQHYLYLETQIDLREIKISDDVPLERNQVQQSTVRREKNIIQETKKNKFIKSYRMEQKRLIRSSETHYLDHPFIGIIVQIRRAEESTLL